MSGKIKVLFVSSGNSFNGISPITKNQGDSLIRYGVKVSYFPILGKGIFNYLSGAIKLRKHLSTKEYDVIHAHYSLSAFVATIAGAKPLVVSLMGSDAKSSALFRVAIFLFARLFWDQTIVKSDKMSSGLRIKDITIIPNGVNLNTFYPMAQIISQRKLCWDSTKRHILFPAKSSRPEKNFALAEKAVSLLKDINLELHSLEDEEPQMIPVLMNAADIILLTSFWEGSPNVIKEAMACNRPVVATDVGDVSQVIGNTDGCFITSFDSIDIADKIKSALQYAINKRETDGRRRILNLGLDSDNIAEKIIEVYEKAILQ